MMLPLIFLQCVLTNANISEQALSAAEFRERAEIFATYLTTVEPAISPLPVPYSSIIFYVSGPEEKTGGWHVSTVAGDLSFFDNGQLASFTRRANLNGPTGTGAPILSEAQLLQKAQSYWITAFGEPFGLFQSDIPQQSFPGHQQRASFHVNPKHRGIPFNPLGGGQIIFDPENGSLYEIGCTKLPKVPATTSHIPAVSLEEAEGIAAQAAWQINPQLILRAGPAPFAPQLTWTVPMPRSFSMAPYNQLPDLYADKRAADEAILMYATPLEIVPPDPTGSVTSFVSAEIDAQTGGITKFSIHGSTVHFSSSDSTVNQEVPFRLGLDWGDGPTTILFQGKTLPTRGDVVTSNQPLGAGPAVNLGIRRGRMFLGAQYYPKTGLLQFRGMRGRPTGELAQALRKSVPARPQPESR